MPDGPEIAVFVLLALPGLLFVALYDSLASTREREITMAVVIVIIVSILSYLAIEGLRIMGIGAPSPAILLQASRESLPSVFGAQQLLIVGLASAIGSILGILTSFAQQHELVHRALRRCRVTRRSGYASHWDSVSHVRARDAWVGVYFSDGTQVVGWADSFSDASEERSLALTRVSKYDANGERIEWRPDELLFIPDLSVVRSIRITPVHKETKRDDTKATGWFWPWRRKASADGPSAAAVESTTSTDG